MGASGLATQRLIRHLARSVAASLLLALAFAGGLPTPLSAQPAPAEIETGKLDVRIDNGFARLVFTFTHRPRHTITADSGVMVLRFDRPIDVPLKELERRLPGIVPSYRVDADKKAIRVALNRKFRINTSEAGEQLFVDLLPEPWKGALPDLPPEVVAELTRQAEEAERLKKEQAERQRRQAARGNVSIIESEAPSFSRLEFVWAQKPSPIVRREGSQTQIAFDGIGIFEEGKARARLPRLIDGIHFDDVDYRSLVTLDVDPKLDVRSFVDGNTFVIDIIGPEKADGVEALAGEAKQALPAGQAVSRLQGKLGDEGGDNGKGKVDKNPVPQPEAPVQSPVAPAAPAVGEAPKPSQPALAAAPVPVPQPRPVKAGGGAVKASPEPVERPAPANQAASAAILPPAEAAPAARVKTSTPEPAISAPARPATQQPIFTTPSGETAEAIAKIKGLQVSSDYADGLAKIDFAFPKTVAAAAFLRGSTLWLVFDDEAKVDLETALVKVRRKVRAIDSEQRDHRYVIRLLVEDANLVAAQADGTVWHILIGDAPPHTASGLDVKPRYTADGKASLHVATGRASSLLRLADPVVGDNLTIVTLMPPESEIAKAQNFVEADFLRTVQGIAIKENVDDLAVHIDKEAVIIERSAGLALSTLLSSRAELQSAATTPELRSGFVDFQAWKRGPTARFSAIKQELVARAAASDGQARNDARLDLARFYLAHELGPEALSELTFAASQDALIERDKSFHILKGVSAVLSRRFDMADRELGDPEFDDSPDVALWRGLAAHERGDWGKARRYLRTAHPVLDQYPRNLQRRALLGLAEAQIELGDIGGMEILLDEIANLDQTSASKGQLALIHGRYSEMLGRVDTALFDYREAQRGALARVEAEALLRYTELASKIKTMPREQTIENLTQVNFAWRGDAIELKARQLLVRLAIEDGRYRDAFSMMRAASAAQPTSPVALAIQDEARAAFADLFSDQRQSDLSAVERLALFYDFQDLVPSGKRGDSMIRKLSGRLVDVDLLDQAAELLSFQVEKRLTGAERAEVAGQLAFIHLLNREPEKALTILRRTRQAQLSNDIERQRNLVEARALAQVGRGKLAVELLSGEVGAEFKRLKADLLWESKDYAEAGLAIEDELGETWKAREPLSPVQRTEVLRAAVAHALAGDQAAVDRVRQRFGDAMAGTPDAVTFNVLTGRIEAQGTEFRQIARNIAAVNTLEGFLKEYRERYRPGGGRPEEPRAEAASAPPRG